VSFPDRKLGPLWAGTDSGELQGTRMATRREIVNSRGFFGRQSGRASMLFSNIAQGKAGRFVNEIANTVGAIGKFAIGPGMWGAAAGTSSRTFLGAIAKRAIGPGIMLGAFGLISATRGLLNGGYTTTGPNVAWGHTPGISTPYEDTTMTFSAANRMAQDMAATGSIAFALHNRRKA
jgi:hypothetical protein